MKVIYLGAGTFWLTEAIYRRVKGTVEVIPGYMGGEAPNPSSEMVATGNTGHAEVVKIVYDEHVVTLEQLLRIFYAVHDPAVSQHAGQGIGSQYRPVIFYTDDSDGESTSPDNGSDVGIIPRVIEAVQSRLPEGVSVTTHVMTAKEFYGAEEYHYDYFTMNPDAAYSVEVIAPKLHEVMQAFPETF